MTRRSLQIMTRRLGQAANNGARATNIVVRAKIERPGAGV
jgi:hypothetical protein